MELLYEEQYHGKCLCDAICGLVKAQFRREAYYLNSTIAPAAKNIIYSHTALAEFGRKKFGKDNSTLNTPLGSNKASKLHRIIFWTLDKGEVEESTETLLGRGIDYEASQVTRDLQKHQFWGVNKQQHGDLRGRDQICACGPCMQRAYFDCELGEEVGAVRDFYCQPQIDSSREEEDVAALAAASLAFCKSAVPGTLLVWPDRKSTGTGSNAGRHAYWVCVTCTAAQSTIQKMKEPAKPKEKKPNTQLPTHMYWGYNKDQSPCWQPMVHVQFYEPAAMGVHQQMQRQFKRGCLRLKIGPQ